jgi:spore germination protein GerM
MKKLFSALFSICFIFILGCSNVKQSANNEPPKPNTETSKNATSNFNENPESEEALKTSNYTLKDYYPFKSNVKYEYEGKGNEYAEYSVWVDYVKGDRLQLRQNNGGTEVVNVLENKNGELKIIFSKEEVYYREDFTSKPSNKNEILLKEPLVKGTSWILGDGRKRYISNINVDITTPLGNYKALEVTTEGKDFKNIDYYALNIGLIKSIYKSGDMEVSSTLKKLSENTPLVQRVNFYYPNTTDDKIYYIQKDLNFKTNDLTKISFESLLKQAPNKSFGKVLGPNVKIKSLYLNGEVVYVDFTKELVSEMNAGSGYESNLLQCITNTFGDYYNVNKVYITIEGSPYESGHISMKKGETFTVNTKDIAEFKK